MAKFDSESGREANAKIKNRSGGKTFSTEANLTASSETVSACISNVQYWFGRGKVRTDDECLERLEEFFNRCIDTGEYPTVEKMCVALGVTRKCVWEWEKGSQGMARAVMIQQAKEALAAIDSDLVQQGKIPQVAYIFRSKNYYGMTDTTRVEVNTHDILSQIDDTKVIEQKYIDALPMN